MERSGEISGSSWREVGISQAGTLTSLDEQPFASENIAAGPADVAEQANEVDCSAERNLTAHSTSSFAFDCVRVLQE